MKNKSSIGYWLLVIGFWLLVSHLPFTIYHLPNAASAVGKTTSMNTLTAAPDPNSDLRHQLWRAEISIVKDEKDKITRNELQRVIEQIRSVKFGPRKETLEPVVVPEKVLVDEPNEALSDTQKQQRNEVKPKLPYEPVTEQTLRILKDLSQHLDNLRNSFELGETLYLSGNLKEAATFYQEALKRISPDDADSVRDRAWILFQIGNCLRNDDPAEAIKMYGQLIAEYSNSQWKQLAQTRIKLLDWYLKENPHKLIAERKL